LGRAFKLGYVFGLISNTLLLFWIGYAHIPGAIVAILALSFYTAILFLVYAQIQRFLQEKTIFLLPFLWVGMEYGRSLGEIAFPWLNLAYTQTYYVHLIQYSSLTGVWGVSFWVALLNVLVYLGIKNFSEGSRQNAGNDRKKLLGLSAIFIILIVIPYIYGMAVIPKEKEKGEVKIALLQGDIDPEVKWDERFLGYNFDVYTKMSREVGKEKVDLLIWPETACPCYLIAEPGYFKMIQSLSESLNTEILTGTNHYRYWGESLYVFYNSAFLFKPYGEFPTIYSKIHLVPGSERLPFSDKVRIMRKLQLGQADFSPGNELVVFNNHKGKFAVLICFESIFPDLVRRFVIKGADFLVNITNDAWWGKTSGPFQHSQIAVFRAIENRISIARCANSGVSMFIDPYGRTYQKTKIFVRETVIGEIPIKKETTFYTLYGDWLGKGCFFVSILFFILSFFIKKV
jgi:apolipoprotein N-acyltransferase